MSNEAEGEVQTPVEILVADHRRFLAFVRSRVKDEGVAEEILQNAFVKGIESLPQAVDGGRSG